MLQLAVLSAISKSNNINIDKEDLKKYLENYDVTIESIGEVFLVDFKNNRKYIINQDGEINVKDGLLSIDISNASNKDEFYGSIINNYGKIIDTSLNDCWKIFYADEKNIYIITDSYIKNTTLPIITDEDGITPKYSYMYGNTNWKAYFSSNGNNGIFLQYPFTNEGIVKIPILEKYASLSTINELNKDFFITNNYTGINQPNMKSTVSMLDTNLWKTFMDDSNGNGKSKYAIGGPTIEMLLKSYNETHGTNYGAKAFNNNGIYGYKINIDANKDISDTSWSMYISDMLDEDDANNLYINENEGDNATAYWLASPSASNVNSSMRVYYDGLVTSIAYNNANCGFRPVVCLKSDVQLEKQSDGSYNIK